jgi:hypothetical protein
MRWVVELPAPSGGTAATVTVDADSWAGALSSARGGTSIRKFRCEFEAEGVVRVNDLEANERYTVRPYRASLVPSAEVTRVGPAPAPAPAPAAEPAPAAAPAVAVPPASGRASRAPAPSATSGAFAVAPPPGTTVAMPPRSSAPPTPPIAADPVPDIDVPSALSSTMITSSVPAVAPTQPPAAHDVPPATTPAVPTRPAAVAPPAPAAPNTTPVVTTPVVNDSTVVESAPLGNETEATASSPAEAHSSRNELSDTTVDLPIFVAPTAQVPPPAAETAAEPPNDEAPHDASVANGSSAESVASTLLFERDQDPSPTNPLTYRERVYAVAAGTSVTAAESVARVALTTLKRSLATRPRGRYVTVAVFDHVFTQRPAESPVVVLRWKDWRSDVPELAVRPPLPQPPAPVAVPAAEAQVEPRVDAKERASEAGPPPAVAAVEPAPVTA